MRVAAIVAGGIAIGLCACEAPRPVEAPRDAAIAVAPAVAAPAPAVDAAVAAAKVVVVKVEGKVERSRGGGAATPVVVGEGLDPTDVIRTGDGAAATVEVGGSLVEVDARSAVSVVELAANASRIRLSDGRIAAEVRGEGARMKVEVAHSDAVADAGRGRFSVLTNGGGHVTVASKDAQVVVSARGKAVTIGAGQLSVVAPDQAPSGPTQIPTSLFLKVGGPATTAQREKTTQVQGATVPGAVIGVNGVKVVAGRDGTFAASVPLREGANTLVVQVEDVMGRQEKRALPTITVDSKAPKVKHTVTW
jgi:hypothetical protein